MRGGIAFVLLAVAMAGVGDAATIDWVERIYGDDAHNAFTDLASWKGQYYVCFRHATSHSSLDGSIRIMRSADMHSWTPCGEIDTAGDDRDPHFTIAGERLCVFFGTWDIAHMEGDAPPDRKIVRTYMSSTSDGEKWSKVAGTYDAGWWLWRVEYHNDMFYSPAYTAVRPKPDERETRLLQSPDGVHWSQVSTVTNQRLTGEAALRFNADGSAWLITRANDETGTAVFASSNPAKTEWKTSDLGVLVHSPAIVQWKDRFFMAGRAKEGKDYVTRVWEVKGLPDVPQLEEVVTLPSKGDTAYPGLLVDSASMDKQTISLYVTWYSQHETDGENAANIYAAQVTVD